MWCPKCKTEYQKGITICAECGSGLVEGTEDDFVVSVLCELKEETTATKLMEYLEFSGIGKAGIKEENGVFSITVPDSQYKQAEKLLRGFMIALQEDQENNGGESIQEEFYYEDMLPGEEEIRLQNNKVTEEEDKQGQTNKKADESPEGILYNSSKTYTKKADEYKDVKVSGITFVVFGLIGVLYLILCEIEVLPISYNKIVFICLLCMFIIFAVWGTFTVFKSRKIKGQIEEEETLTAGIKEWIDANVTSEMIESWKDKNASEEENELIIISQLGTKLINYYTELDTSYLEMVADEYFNEKLSHNNV